MAAFDTILPGSALFLVLGLALSGCATSRGTLDLRATEVGNPAAGPAVRIATVTDQRRFELAPKEPSIPSLGDGEIEDRSLTSRAIARKRNTYGKAMGDILLPDGRTVEILVAEIVTSALRESGYRVLDQTDPSAAEGVPLEVEIDRFWAWFMPGFAAAHLEFEVNVGMKGPLPPFDDSEWFRSHTRLATQAATAGAWQNTINKGLLDLRLKMLKRLRAGRTEGTEQ